MSALTRHLRSHVKSERRSQRLEISKRADAGQSTTGMPEPPAKDADLDSMEAGANEMTIMEEETVWEKIRLLLPWQNDEDKADAEMKSTKRELQQARPRIPPSSPSRLSPRPLPTSSRASNHTPRQTGQAAHHPSPAQASPFRAPPPPAFPSRSTADRSPADPPDRRGKPSRSGGSRSPSWRRGATS